MDILTRDEFLKHLREALNHLQDPDHLRRSPLAAFFGVANRFDTFTAMQEILVEAIESLEPPADEPAQSRAWRIYESLYYRYIQQLSQREVADQLGVGTRQVRREQRAALEALADQLWERLDLGKKVREQEDASAKDAAPHPVLSEELAWLRDAPPGESAVLDETLSDVVDLARQLAERHEVRLEIEVGHDLPSLAAHPVALTQILLNVLGVAFHRASGGQVTVSATSRRWDVEIGVQGQGAGPASQPIPDDDDQASLGLARQLAELCGGRLALDEGVEGFDATLHIPAVERLPVLAIDDNADTLQLLQRYTSGTRYRLVGTRDPEQALALAQELAPQIVVLDVMMPQVDGWKVLRRLRQHPGTGHVPVVVCTILAQEELALSLGASALVRKPFTRQEILDALDGQVKLLAPESD